MAETMNSNGVIRNPPSLSISQLCFLLCWHYCGKEGPVSFNFKWSLAPSISEVKGCFISSSISDLEKFPFIDPVWSTCPTPGPVMVLILISPSHVTESSTRFGRSNSWKEMDTWHQRPVLSSEKGKEFWACRNKGYLYSMLILFYVFTLKK